MSLQKKELPMLFGVLRSRLAVHVNISIMRLL